MPPETDPQRYSDSDDTGYNEYASLKRLLRSALCPNDQHPPEAHHNGQLWRKNTLAIHQDKDLVFLSQEQGKLYYVPVGLLLPDEVLRRQYRSARSLTKRYRRELEESTVHRYGDDGDGGDGDDGDDDGDNDGDVGVHYRYEMLFPRTSADGKLSMRLDDPNTTHELVFNATGDALLVREDYTVWCVMLPQDRHVNLPTKSLVCTDDDDIVFDGSPFRSFLVGRDMYPNEVLKVEWHPLSATHVAILTSDNTIRMYNLARGHPAKPEQKFVLETSSADEHGYEADDYNNLGGNTTPRSRDSSGFGLTPTRHGSSLPFSPIARLKSPSRNPELNMSMGSVNRSNIMQIMNSSYQSGAMAAELMSEMEKDRVISFVFGSRESDRWGKFSIFAVTSSARIILICPVIPFNCSIPEHFLSVEDLVMPEQSPLISKFLSSVVEGYEQPIYQYSFDDSSSAADSPASVHLFARMDRRRRISTGTGIRYMRTRAPIHSKFKPKNIRPVLLPLPTENDDGSFNPDGRDDPMSIFAKDRCVDISCVTSTPSSVSGLALLNIKGQIGTVVLLGDVYPSFSNESASSLSKSLQLYPLDNVDLSLPMRATPNYAKVRPASKEENIPSTPFFIQRGQSGHTIYCVNSAGIHEISFPSINRIQRLLTTGQLQELDEQVEPVDDAPIALHIINSMPQKSSKPSMPDGFAMLNYQLTGTFAVSLDSAGRCHLVPSEIMFIDAFHKDDAMYEKIFEDLSSEDLPKFVLPEITSTTSVRGDSPGGLELLKVFTTNFSENYYEFILKLHRAITHRVEHIAAVKREQETNIQEIEEKIQQQRTTHETLERQIEEINEDQKRLDDRVKVLLETLRLNEPTSIAEKEFAHVVNRCNNIMKERKRRMNGAEYRTKNLISYYEQQMPVTGTYSANQINKIEKILGKTATTIEDLVKMATEIEARLKEVR